MEQTNGKIMYITRDSKNRLELHETYPFKQVSRKGNVNFFNTNSLRLHDSSLFQYVTPKNSPLRVTLNVMDVPKPYCESPNITVTPFSEIDVNQQFFDSYREEYSEFNEWFTKCAKEGRMAYTVFNDGRLVAFLALKVETEKRPADDYGKRMINVREHLKICSFKVAAHGKGISQRFMDIVYKRALKLCVSDVYVTVYDTSEERRNLIRMLNGRYRFDIDDKPNERGETVLRKKTLFINPLFDMNGCRLDSIRYDPKLLDDVPQLKKKKK